MWTMVGKVVVPPGIPIGVLWPCVQADWDCNKVGKFGLGSGVSILSKP